MATGECRSAKGLMQSPQYDPGAQSLVRSQDSGGEDT